MSEVLSHILLGLAWLSWCVLHSVLIAPWWIRRMRRLLGKACAYYRFAYVLLSIATLLPVLYWQWTLPSRLLWSWTLPWSVLQWIGIIVSFGILYLGAREYNQAFFFGWQQIRDHLDERTSEFSGFAAGGILAHVRHPYYSGGILFLLCWGDLTVSNLLMKVIGIGYLVVGAYIEERKLQQEFGDAYREYMRNVPMFIPSLRPSRQTGSVDH